MILEPFARVFVDAEALDRTRTTLEAERKIVREGLVIYAKALEASRDAEAELAEMAI